ncbi:armadillo repeat-containing protein 7 isoform X1 [Gadus macrocephalus]|uniref:armadillo repeat-containing protein 7 isoform X1 n=1 Tax=Gadus macrocephalus TaxID=80720 RepID=UPI0028CB9FB9|nr:armadillo repeat-containing protein 7 isoform X1 [Gadus macrocephalus]
MSRKRSSDRSDRFDYLQTLVTEFQDTDNDEAKEQVLANLANFSYDPKNMEDLRMLQVTDLFLDMLTEDNENFVEFGMAALYVPGAPRWTMQPQHGPGLPGPHPGERRDPAGHRLPLRPQRGDRPLRHHHPHEPDHGGVAAPGHRAGRGAVHAALLPVREPPPAEPGLRVPAGLLHGAAGGPGAADHAGRPAHSAGDPAARGLGPLRRAAVSLGVPCPWGALTLGCCLPAAGRISSFLWESESSLCERNLVWVLLLIKTVHFFLVI